MPLTETENEREHLGKFDLALEKRFLELKANKANNFLILKENVWILFTGLHSCSLHIYTNIQRISE